MKARIARRAFLATISLLTTACVGAPQDQILQAWEQPVWMAYARAEISRYQDFMIECLKGKDLQGVPSASGPVLVVTSVNSNDSTNHNSLEMVNEAHLECLEDAPEVSFWVTSQDIPAFERMIDVRNCLIAKGGVVPKAPSASIWIEQNSPWNPVLYVTGNAAEIAIRSCPQSGPGIVAVHFS
jgi:hypothetical protein